MNTQPVPPVVETGANPPAPIVTAQKTPPSSRGGKFADAKLIMEAQTKGHTTPGTGSTPTPLTTVEVKPATTPAAPVDEEYNFDKVYGACAGARYQFNVETGEGSLAELVTFVRE